MLQDAGRDADGKWVPGDVGGSGIYRRRRTRLVSEILRLEAVTDRLP
jgi:hypothetical protein